jgi:hypothetical protein
VSCFFFKRWDATNIDWCLLLERSETGHGWQKCHFSIGKANVGSCWPRLLLVSHHYSTGNIYILILNCPGNTQGSNVTTRHFVIFNKQRAASCCCCCSMHDPDDRRHGRMPNTGGILRHFVERKRGRIGEEFHRFHQAKRWNSSRPAAVQNIYGGHYYDEHKPTSIRCPLYVLYVYNNAQLGLIVCSPSSSSVPRTSNLARLCTSAPFLRLKGWGAMKGRASESNSQIGRLGVAIFHFWKADSAYSLTWQYTLSSQQL